MVESLQSWLNDSLQSWLEPFTGTKSTEAGSETEQERQQKIIQEVLNLMSYRLSLPYMSQLHSKRQYVDQIKALELEITAKVTADVKADLLENNRRRQKEDLRDKQAQFVRKKMKDEGVACMGFSLMPARSVVTGSTDIEYIVNKVAEGSDAMHRGLQAGMKVSSIDGQPLRGSPEIVIRRLLLGPEDSVAKVAFETGNFEPISDDTVEVMRDCEVPVLDSLDFMVVLGAGALVRIKDCEEDPSLNGMQGKLLEGVVDISRPIPVKLKNEEEKRLLADNLVLMEIPPQFTENIIQPKYSIPIDQKSNLTDSIP